MSPEPRSPGMTRADLGFGLALAALGAYVVIASWRMPRLDEQGIEPLSAPGVVPGLLGAVFLLFGAALVLRSLRRGGLRGWPRGAGVRAGLSLPGTRRLLLALALCLVYALVLIGTLPFAWATAVFVTGFILAFEYRIAEPPRAQRKLLVMSVLQGALTGIVVMLVFEKLFLVTLP